MKTRRQIILALSALTGGTLVYSLGNNYRGANQYRKAIDETWRHTPEKIKNDISQVHRELVRHATLAASSHNTQCWKFKIEDDAIAILPDWTRRCPVVDPDNHHFFISLGCAAENILQAAQAFGKHGSIHFNSVVDDAIKVILEPSQPSDSQLFDAIPHRQCSRVEYDGKKLSNEELNLLELSGKGNGVRVLLITETEQIENILDYVIQANTIQISDRAFVEELKSWIRFSYEEVVEKKDGLFAASSGNPVVPRWLGMKLLDAFLSTESENEKYAKQIRSSAGIAIFASDKNDQEHWVETGRCYERFALQATALGIKNAFINQPIEVALFRPQISSYLGIGDLQPDLIVRFGYGSNAPRSLRRPIEEVLV